MREIIPNRLWIGNAADARDLARVYESGIGAVIDLAMEQPPAPLTRELIHCRFPLIDGGGNALELLHAAIATTATLIRQEIPLLVACGAGMSRSPLIVAAALALVRGQSPEAVLQEVSGEGPHDVSTSLWADVKSAYNAMVG